MALMARLIMWALRAVFSLVIFYVVYTAGKNNGADANLTLILATAAAFGTLYVSIKLGH